MSTVGNYTFDGPNKLIILIPGVREVVVQDLWSRWEDWLVLSDNIKFLPAMRSVGGDTLTASKDLGISYFLLNGWKIQPNSVDHTLVVVGNLYTDPAGTSKIEYPPGYSISVEFEVSNLIDSVATGGGGGSDPWNTVLPGSYAAGRAGYILGNNLDVRVSEVPNATWAHAFVGKLLTVAKFLGLK